MFCCYDYDAGIIWFGGVVLVLLLVAVFVFVCCWLVVVLIIWLVMWCTDLYLASGYCGVLGRWDCGGLGGWKFGGFGGLLLLVACDLLCVAL